ncbi:MAG: hypothetical protein RR595_11770 [Lysinibacillus sp.]
MGEKKFAQLDSEQLEKINELEQNMGLTLIAYDVSVTQQVASEVGYNSTSESHSP